ADLLSGLVSTASSAAASGLSPAEEIRSAIFSGSRRQQLLCRSGSSSDGFIQSGEFVEDSGKLMLNAARFPASSGYLENRTLLLELKMVSPFSFPGTRDKNGFELNVTGLSIDMINEVASRLKF
uniref:RNase_PH domain-containing protein n=1 Tax=Macrostomum lignano TaxID=282301 RepID=A0A1I8HYZ8_9PLAT